MTRNIIDVTFSQQKLPPCPFGPLWFASEGETARPPSFSLPLRNEVLSCHTEANRPVYLLLLQNHTYFTCLCCAVPHSLHWSSGPSKPSSWSPHHSSWLPPWTASLLAALDQTSRGQKLYDVWKKKHDNKLLTHFVIVKGVVVHVFFLLVVKEQVTKFLQVFPFA